MGAELNIFTVAAARAQELARIERRSINKANHISLVKLGLTLSPISRKFLRQFSSSADNTVCTYSSCI